MTFEYAFAPLDRATRARLQFVTEPPATYRLPTVRSCCRAASSRRDSSEGSCERSESISTARSYPSRTAVVNPSRYALASPDRGGRSSNRTRPSRAVIGRTSSAVPSGEESSTTSTSGCSGRSRTPAITRSIVSRSLNVGSTTSVRGDGGSGSGVAGGGRRRRGMRNRIATRTIARIGNQSPHRT